MGPRWPTGARPRRLNARWKPLTLARDTEAKKGPAAIPGDGAISARTARRDSATLCAEVERLVVDLEVGEPGVEILAAREPGGDVDAGDHVVSVRGHHVSPRLLVGRDAVTAVVVVPHVARYHVERERRVLVRRDGRALRAVEDHVVIVVVQEDAQVRRPDGDIVTGAVLDRVDDLGDLAELLAVHAGVEQRAAVRTPIGVWAEVRPRGGQADRLVGDEEALGEPGPVRASRTLRAGVALVALRAFRAGLALVALRAGGTGCALGPGGAGLALERLPGAGREVGRRERLVLDVLPSDRVVLDAAAGDLPGAVRDTGERHEGDCGEEHNALHAHSFCWCWDWWASGPRKHLRLGRLTAVCDRCW